MLRGNLGYERGKGDMSDLIKKEEVIKVINEYFGKKMRPGDYMMWVSTDSNDLLVREIRYIPTVYYMDKKSELRILRNFISNMTKVYRANNPNWMIVQDILLQGTSTSGAVGCFAKCKELGIDPYGYTLEVVK